MKKSSKVMSAAMKTKRNFPTDTLEEALALAQAIADESGGRPLNRLLLAAALRISPGGSPYRVLLSSSLKYGLTLGTEKATDIQLTELGDAATQSDPTRRQAALRTAALTPELFKRFFTDYQNRKLPSPDMLGRILTATYGVPQVRVDDCQRILFANATFCGLTRDISGSMHVLFNAEELPAGVDSDESIPEGEDEVVPTLPAAPLGVLPSRGQNSEVRPLQSAMPSAPGTEPPTAKPIFIGHGKNRGPLEKLERLLNTFKIQHRVTVREANLGRPIPTKVRATMEACGSAILIFTRDEKLFDEKGGELWRPSENVVHELGAASYLYGDRIVIFKERGLHLPTNFENIGNIEFDIETMESKTTDLLKELIGFGLVKVTPV